MQEARRSRGPTGRDEGQMAVVRLLFILFFAAVILAVCVFVLVIIICRMTQVKAWWHSPPVVLFRLGGIATLRRTLNYRCSLCQDSMEAGDKIRTLSCGHVFHCGATVKCKNDIDKWLRTAPEMSCPLCRQTPRPVLPWKRPPPSSPAPSTSASASTSTPDLVEPLLPPAHDETLPEASSSAPAPPLAQSPPDLEAALPLPTDKEILPNASSSQ